MREPVTQTTTVAGGLLGFDGGVSLPVEVKKELVMGGFDCCQVHVPSSRWQLTAAMADHDINIDWEMTTQCSLD
jgi:hypothetical protein